MAIKVGGGGNFTIFLYYDSNNLAQGDDKSWAFGFWTYVTSGNSRLEGANIMAYSNTNSDQVRLGVQNDKARLFLVHNNVSNSLYSDANCNINAWNHIAVVNSSGNFRHLYLNGVKKAGTFDIGTNFSVAFQNITGMINNDNRQQPVSEVSYWSSGVPEADMIAMSNRISPLIVRPQNLDIYMPLYNILNLTDYMNSTNDIFIFTGTNVSGYPHPNIFNKSYISYPGQTHYNTIPLFLKCGPSSECLPYSSGDGAFSDAFDFDFSGQLCGNPPGWHMNLYMDARQISSGTMDLYQYGQAPNSGNMTLFLKVIDNIPQIENESSMNLFLQGRIAHGVSGDMTVFMWSSTHSGLYEHMDLFIDAVSSGVKNQSMNLMLKNELAESITSTMNVMLKGLGNADGSISINQNFPLYLANNYTACSGDMTLMMCGPSGTDGAIPFSGMMNLFMGRQNDSFANNISLYMSGPDGFSGTMTMYLEGQPRPTGIIPLYIEAPNASVTEHVTLYTHGF